MNKIEKQIEPSEVEGIMRSKGIRDGRLGRKKKIRAANKEMIIIFRLKTIIL